MCCPRFYWLYKELYIPYNPRMNLKAFTWNILIPNPYNMACGLLMLIISVFLALRNRRLWAGPSASYKEASHSFCSSLNCSKPVSNTQGSYVCRCALWLSGGHWGICMCMCVAITSQHKEEQTAKNGILDMAAFRSLASLIQMVSIHIPSASLWHRLPMSPSMLDLYSP